VFLVVAAVVVHLYFGMFNVNNATKNDTSLVEIHERSCVSGYTSFGTIA